MAMPEGYRTAAGVRGGRLSPGQRQRISIARALLKDAPIVILDEATAFIDPENEAYVQEALGALLRPADGRARTLIVIAHRLSTIRDADRILVLNGGKLAAAGVHDELLAGCPLYRTMWEAGQNEEAAPRSAPAGPLAAAELAERSEEEPFPAAAQVHPADEGEQRREEQRRRDEQRYGKLFGASFVRKLLLLSEGQRAGLLRACLYAALEAPFVSLAPIAVYLLLKEAIAGRVETFGFYVLLLPVAFLGQMAFFFASQREFFRFNGRLRKELRLYLGAYLRRVPLGYFTSDGARHIETGLIADVATTGSIHQIAFMTIKATVSFAITLTVLEALDWRQALASAAGIPCAAIVLALADRRFYSMIAAQTAVKAEALARMTEFIQGIAVIRAFRLLGSRLSRYETAMKAYRDAGIGVQKRLSSLMAWYGATFEFGFVFVFVAGSVLFAAGRIDGTALLLGMILALRLYEPLPLLEFAASRRFLQLALGRLRELTTLPRLPEPAPDRVQRPAGRDAEFAAVSFGYDQGREVLRDVSFRMPAGSVTALVGPSGGGKTTILNLLARFWDVAAGEVRIGGVNVRELRTDTLMSMLAIVFQDVYLFKDTVRNNIVFGRPETSEAEMVAAAKAARCHDFIMQLPQGYETVIGEGGGTLSGGEKQRIAIARTIVKDAPIVLLDEATASIDPDNERSIHEALGTLTAGKTLLVIAHRLHTIRHADQVLVLDRGQIVQRGTHDELIGEEGLYRRFWLERSRAETWAIRGRGALPLH